MSEEATLREDICRIGKSMFDRGLTCGASGNISARLSDGRLLITPTGASLGFLDPARLTLVDEGFHHLGGDAPTKETPLHSAFYNTRAGTGAVVHLHSTHSVALSMMEGIDPENVLPPLTPYAIMRLGKVQLLPFFLPGDPGMAGAVRGLAGRRSAVLLANHGPVVAGKDLWAATYAIEELEETAKLALLTRGHPIRALTDTQIETVVKTFDVEW